LSNRSDAQGKTALISC